MSIVKPYFPKIQKNFLYILGSLFILILVILFSFYYYDNYQYTLAKFAPEESTFYLNLNTNKLNNQKQINLYKDQLEKYFGLDAERQNQFFSLIDNKIAIAVLPKEDKLQIVLILKVKNKKEFEEFVSNTGPNYKHLDKNYTAISNLSLENVDFQKSILNNGLFRSKLSRLKWYDGYGLINYNNQPILFTLNDKKDKTVFEIAYYQEDPFSKIVLENQEKINKGFQITFNTKNLKNDFENWQKNLGLSEYNRKLDFFENRFKFDLEKDILYLADYSSQISILNPKESQTKWWPQRETHLFIKNPYEILPLEQIEKLVKTAISHFLPESEEKILSDGTKINEIVAKPDNFQFEDVDFQNSTFRQLKEERTGFEFSYGMVDDQLIFTNSLNTLQNIPKIDDFNQIIVKPTGDLSKYFEQIVIKTDKNRVKGYIY